MSLWLSPSVTAGLGLGLGLARRFGGSRAWAAVRPARATPQASPTPVYIQVQPHWR